jgi:hypothetical protein
VAKEVLEASKQYIETNPAERQAALAKFQEADSEYKRISRLLSKAAANQEASATRHAQGGGGSDGPPNPFWFLLYSILIPIAPLAQIIAGDTYNSISRFLDLTIVPLGFLFYIASIVYDYIILLLYPADLFVAGSKRFFPFTQLGMDPEGHSERLTGVSEIKPCPPDGFITTGVRVTTPFLSYFFPGLGVAVKGALNTATTIKETAVDTSMKGLEVAAAAKAASAPGALPGPPLQVGHLAPNPRILVGGARETFSTLDYLALGSFAAVIGGGFLLSLNRNGNTDSPPNPRGI